MRIAAVASLVSLALPAAATADASPGRIPVSFEGTTTDAVSGRAIAGAQVEVTARYVRARDDHGARTYSLAPLSYAGAPLASTLSDHNGRFRVDFSGVAHQPYFKVVVSASGYRPLANTLVRAEEVAATTMAFELVPLELDPQHVVELQHEQALEKAELYARMRKVEPQRPTPTSPTRRRGPTASAATEYAVPEEVFVVELPGSSYTGFIDFDEYIAGVVAAEMGDTFPFEALKVQAVASRTFALERYERSGAANGGQAYSAFFAELGESHLASLNTSGGVLLYDGVPPTAFFSARCNGDRTLDSEDGLSCIPNGCSNPCTVGGLVPDADPLPYVRSRECSGHVNCSLTTEACCSVFADGRTQHIYGHGVGMCQRGAQQFACRDGIGFDEMLFGYYSEVMLANAPGLAPGARVATTTALNARRGPCDPDRVVVATNTAGTVVAGRRIEHCSALGSCLGSAGTYWTWWQVDFDDGTAGRWVVEDFIELIAPASTAPPQCGRPFSGATTARVSDCLFILKAAVGSEICDPECLCAPAGTLPASADDALVCMANAVGLDAPMACPC